MKDNYQLFIQYTHATYYYATDNQGPSWSWSYGSWIYNYLCNQYLLPLMWVRISIRARCTALCDKVCQRLATGRWFSPGPPVSSTNKTDRHDITEILWKVALNTIKHTSKQATDHYLLGDTDVTDKPVDLFVLISSSYTSKNQEPIIFISQKTIVETMVRRIWQFNIHRK